MSVFRVKAATAEGRIRSTEVEAASKEEAELKLEKDGLFPIEVKATGAGVRLPFVGKKKGKVKKADFHIFNKGLVALLKAGLPVVECLETLGEQTANVVFKSAVADVVQEVKNGQPLSEALTVHSDIFPPLYTASISAGEKTGDLIPTIKSYIEYEHRIELVRKKVVSAAAYPAILMVFSGGIIIFLLSYVVPSLAKIYLDSGTELPAATKALIAMSGFIVGHYILIIVSIIVLVFILRFYLKTDSARRLIDRAKINFPQLGDIYRSYAVGKFSMTLGMVLRSGVHLVRALEMARGVLDNSILEARLDEVIKKAKEGGTVAGAMGEAGLMPEVTLRMFSVGEKSASLTDMLTDIADFHDEDVEHKVGIITSLIEPALMVIMGLVIGTIIILLYIPIFQMGSAIN